MPPQPSDISADENIAAASTTASASPTTTAVSDFLVVTLAERQSMDGEPALSCSTPRLGHRHLLVAFPLCLGLSWSI
jgi:hypothetical protein